MGAAGAESAPRKETRTMTLTDLRNAAAAAALAVALSSPALAADRAQELINSLGCKGCHKLGGSGGTLGPALDGVGKRLGEKQLRDKLVNPKATNPQTMMPAFANLPEKDLKTLVDYLKGL
jgi:mono/diheme cytochrome c family protein